MMLQRLGIAATFLFLGLREILSRPKLILLSLAPLTVDVLLFTLGFTYGTPVLHTALDSAMAWIFTSKDTFLFQVAYYPMLVLFWMVFVISLTTSVYLLASVIASPFNALIAETILVSRNLVPAQKFTFISFIAFSLRMVAISAARASILIFLSIFVFIVSFLPGVNLLSSYFAAVLISFDAADYTLELKNYSLKQRFMTLRTLLPEYLGMGIVLILALLLPGFVLLLMPVIVSGATLIVGKALQEPQ